MYGKIVTRAEWGARPPTDRTAIGTVDGVAVHYSASNADEQALHRNCAARVRAIQNYHMSPGGDPTKPWADIAYNFLVCKHGYVFVGRGWGTRSAAQGTNDGNAHFHAVCFLGDDTAGRDDVTAIGRDALARVILNAYLRYPDGRQLRPHSFFHSTGCPGNDLRAFIVHLARALDLP